MSNSVPVTRQELFDVKREVNEVRALAQSIDSRMNTHEAICAERARSTQTAIEGILTIAGKMEQKFDAAVGKMEQKLDAGKNWLIATLLSVLGIGLVSLFGFIVNRILSLSHVGS